jgi:hypothetical protein
MECWSTGVLKKPESGNTGIIAEREKDALLEAHDSIIPVFHRSVLSILHHSNTPLLHGGFYSSISQLTPEEFFRQA